MSFLYCIRHSQASAHAEDYDQLSALGYEQSELLGERLSSMLPTIDHVWYGPRKRHLQTYREPLPCGGRAREVKPKGDSIYRNGCGGESQVVEGASSYHVWCGKA